MKVKILTQELINELLAETERPCISLYMPTHRTHPEIAQDPIRCKNLVKQVEESLTEKFPSAEIQTILEPFETLSSDPDFWNHSGDGLAVLASAKLFKVIRLQQPVEELVIIEESFHTKPLRRILQSQDRYQVLALTLDTMRLFEGNRYSLVEIEILDGFPKTITETLGNELTEKHSTVASYGGVGGESTTTHHGHGGKKAEVDIDAERFFRSVANAVYDHYSKPLGLPLLLAALPEHHHLFNQVNSNPLLLPKGIEINPQSLSVDKLAELSWEIIQPLYLKRLDVWVEKFNQAKANGLGSDTIDEVIEAAKAGRVDTLLLEAHRVNAQRIRNKATGTFEMTDLTQPVLDDELDAVGELVNKMGGKVIIIPKEKMPSHTGMAAIFRY